MDEIDSDIATDVAASQVEVSEREPENPEGVKVWVISYGPKRFFMLRYRHPLTGTIINRSSRTKDRDQAMKRAAILERELLNGEWAPPSKILWSEFRKQYEEDATKRLQACTVGSFNKACDHLERIVKPVRLADVTTEKIADFQKVLREEQYAEASIGSILAHLAAAFTWAETVGHMKHPIKMLRPKRREYELSISEAMKSLTEDQLLEEIDRAKKRLAFAQTLLKAWKLRKGQ